MQKGPPIWYKNTWFGLNLALLVFKKDRIPPFVDRTQDECRVHYGNKKPLAIRKSTGRS